MKVRIRKKIERKEGIEDLVLKRSEEE